MTPHDVRANQVEHGLAHAVFHRPGANIGGENQPPAAELAADDPRPRGRFLISVCGRMAIGLAVGFRAFRFHYCKYNRIATLRLYHRRIIAIPVASVLPASDSPQSISFRSKHMPAIPDFRSSRSCPTAVAGRTCVCRDGARYRRSSSGAGPMGRLRPDLRRVQKYCWNNRIDLQDSYATASPAQRRDIQQKFNALVHQGNAIRPKLKSLAEKVYLDNPKDRKSPN